MAWHCLQFLTLMPREMESQTMLVHFRMHSTLLDQGESVSTHAQCLLVVKSTHYIYLQLATSNHHSCSCHAGALICAQNALCSWCPNGHCFSLKLCSVCTSWAVCFQDKHYYYCSQRSDTSRNISVTN